MGKYLSGTLLCALMSSPAVFFSPLTQNSVAQVHPVISQADYDRLLDVVFSDQQPNTVRLYYSIVLRFMPSTHTESEVAIYALTDNTIRAGLFRVIGSSAWNIANDYIQRVGNPDIQEIARRVKVDKQNLAVSSVQAQTWYSSLQKNIEESDVQLQHEMATNQKTGETTVFLDGTTYEISFAQGLTEVRWRVMDEEVNDTKLAGHSAIARWMNEIRRYALDQVARRGDR